jgi:uracil-DNA glycosylase
MTEATDTQRLAKLVRQHARATKLAGVDFIPVSGGIPRKETVGAAPAPVARPLPDAPFARPPAPAPRPAPVAPRPAAPAAAAPAVAPTASVLIEPKIEIVYTDAPRLVAIKKLDDIRARYEREAPHKHFVTDHHSIVFGEGDPRAKLMFIGEAPGAEEDACGRPFVGRSGQLLSKMIEALGLKRENVYIANVLKTRPPNNATPTLEECARCAPYLFEQIGAVQPEVIVTLGLPATRVVLNTTDSMGNLRGKWSTFPPLGILAPAVATPVPVMPTYHPAFLLRAYTKENRAKVWSDLQQAAKRIGLATSAKAAHDQAQ